MFIKYKSLSLIRLRTNWWLTWYICWSQRCWFYLHSLFYFILNLVKIRCLLFGNVFQWIALIAASVAILTFVQTTVCSWFILLVDQSFDERWVFTNIKTNRLQFNKLLSIFWFLHGWCICIMTAVSISCYTSNFLFKTTSKNAMVNFNWFLF